MLPIAVLSALLALIPTSTCIARIVFGIPCPACGLTRATLSAARLDLAGSLHYHPLGLGLIAVGAVMFAVAFIVRDEAKWRRAVQIVTGAAGVALMVVWALRFAGWFGGPVPR